MSINTSSEQNLVDQCQLTSFQSFKERLGQCCCRMFRKSSTYHVESIQSKSDENFSANLKKTDEQMIEKQKKERENKLDLIAQSLPSTSSSSTTTTKRTTTPSRAVPTKNSSTIPANRLVVPSTGNVKTGGKGTRQPSRSSSSDDSTDDQSSTSSSSSTSDSD